MKVYRLRRRLECVRLGELLEPRDALDAYARSLAIGRWDDGRDRVLYGFERLPVAVLEHQLATGRALPWDSLYRVLTVAAGVQHQRVPADLNGWDSDPPSSSVRAGAAWARAGKSLLLMAPARHLQGEHVWLINTRHVAFKRVTVSEPRLLSEALRSPARAVGFDAVGHAQVDR